MKGGDLGPFIHLRFKRLAWDPGEHRNAYAYDVLRCDYCRRGLNDGLSWMCYN